MKKIIITLIVVFLCTELSAQNKNEQRNNLFLYGAIGIAAVVTGLLVFRFFNKTKEKKGDSIPVIKNIFPNPSHGPVTIQLEGDVSQLQVLNSKGQVLKAFAITGNEIHFDLSSWPRANYIVVAHYGANQSNAFQFTLQ
jgi:hypothetical protein